MYAKVCLAEFDSDSLSISDYSYQILSAIHEVVVNKNITNSPALLIRPDYSELDDKFAKINNWELVELSPTSGLILRSEVSDDPSQSKFVRFSVVSSDIIGSEHIELTVEIYEDYPSKILYTSTVDLARGTSVLDDVFYLHIAWSNRFLCMSNFSQLNPNNPNEYQSQFIFLLSEKTREYILDIPGSSYYNPVVLAGDNDYAISGTTYDIANESILDTLNLRVITYFGDYGWRPSGQLYDWSTGYTTDVLMNFAVNKGEVLNEGGVVSSVCDAYLGYKDSNLSVGSIGHLSPDEYVYFYNGIFIKKG